MSKPSELIEARVWIDPTARTTAFWKGYSPHLVARGSTDYAGVYAVEVIVANDQNAVLPGEVARVQFALLYFDEQVEETVALYQALKAGAEFEIREGPKTVGFGCVINRYQHEESEGM